MNVIRLVRTGLLLAGAALLPGCGAGTRVGRAESAGRLVAVASVRLESDAAALGVDGDRLVVLDAAGTRLLVLDSALSVVGTVPLSMRLTGARGVAADRFYYYVYDDRAVYRMLKDELVLSTWLGNVRAGGVASFAAGEALVSDADRKTVWYKTLFGESRRFLDAVSAKDPGPIATLPGNGFCVLDQSARLVFFNRAGIVTRTASLGGRYDLMAADRSGLLYLASRSSDRICVVDAARQVEYELGEAAGPAGLAIVSGRLAILTPQAQVALYRLP